MKKLILLAILVLGTVSAKAQDYKDFNDWFVKKDLVHNGKKGFIGTFGEVIQGPMRYHEGEYKNPGLTVYQYKEGDDFFIESIEIPFSNYKYDPSGEYNFITVKVIGDLNKSNTLVFKGEINNDKGFVDVQKDQNELYELYNMLKKSNTIHIQLTSTGSTTKFVYKYSAKGFIAADKYAEEVLNKSSTNNPFNEDNPFKG